MHYNDQNDKDGKDYNDKSHEDKVSRALKTRLLNVNSDFLHIQL